MMASETLEPWCDLKDKIVMVTGASSGLGREICLDLGKAGCRIVAAARRIDRLNSLCDQINKMSIPVVCTDEGFHRAVAMQLDVTANGSIMEASVVKAWNIFGRIDVLINNAGVRGKVKTAEKVSEEEWEHEMRTNLRGCWLVSKYTCQLMRDARCGGSIINISSVNGLNRVLNRGSLGYASSKAAIDHMTKIMALEMGDYDIKVNSIAPGMFKSEITEKLFEKYKMNNLVKRTIPLAVSETSVIPIVTSLIRYLIHHSSPYISGNVFIVDAGFSLPSFPIFSSL